MFAGNEGDAAERRAALAIATLQNAAAGRSSHGNNGLTAIVQAVVSDSDQFDLATLRECREDLRRLRRRHDDLGVRLVIDGADVHLRRTKRRLEATAARLAHEHRLKSLKDAVRHLLSVKPWTPTGIARELDVTEVDAHRAIAELRDDNEVILRPVTDSDAPDLDGYWVLDLRTPGRGSVLESQLAKHPDIVEVWIRTTKWWVALPAGEAIARLRAQ